MHVDPIDYNLEYRKVKYPAVKFIIFLIEVWLVVTLIGIWNILVMYEATVSDYRAGIIQFFLVFFLLIVYPVVRYCHLFEKSYTEKLSKVLKWSPILVIGISILIYLIMYMTRGVWNCGHNNLLPGLNYK